MSIIAGTDNYGWFNGQVFSDGGIISTTKTKPNVFKAGDRVKYIGLLSTNLIGHVGTVDHVSPFDVHVMWDDIEFPKVRGVIPMNIKKIDNDTLFDDLVKHYTKVTPRKFHVGEYVRVNAYTDGEHITGVGKITEDDGDPENQAPYYIEVLDDQFCADELMKWEPRNGERVFHEGKPAVVVAPNIAAGIYGARSTVFVHTEGGIETKVVRQSELTPDIKE